MGDEARNEETGLGKEVARAVSWTALSALLGGDPLRPVKKGAVGAVAGAVGERIAGVEAHAAPNGIALRPVTRALAVLVGAVLALYAPRHA